MYSLFVWNKNSPLMIPFDSVFVNLTWFKKGYWSFSSEFKRQYLVIIRFRPALLSGSLRPMQTFINSAGQREKWPNVSCHCIPHITPKFNSVTCLISKSELKHCMEQNNFRLGKQGQKQMTVWDIFISEKQSHSMLLYWWSHWLTLKG